MWRVWGRRDIHAGVWWGNLTKGRHAYRWEDNNRLIEIGWEGRAWSGLMWLRIVTGGRL
jgi:hypothetical protein